jgi:hypothetical protein
LAEESCNSKPEVGPGTVKRIAVGLRAEDYYVSKTMIPFLRAELFFTL